MQQAFFICIELIILAKNADNMKGLHLKEQYIKPAALAETGIFMSLVLIFFLPINIPHKLAFPVFTLFIAGLWLLPWQMCLAMLCSALGDYMGSCGNFIGQRGFFALAHISIITYLLKRYKEKVEPDKKLTAKAKGYLTMVIFCTLALLTVAFTVVLPGAPKGIEKIGASCYAVIISTMLLLGLLQRSSLYALGAVLFVFSDFILAWNRFVEPVPYRNYLVLGTYYLAQWLLFIRSTKYRIKNPVRLMRF
jgi:uncharacterized membrane protein YhhN